MVQEFWATITPPSAVVVDISTDFFDVILRLAREIILMTTLNASRKVYF